MSRDPTLSLAPELPSPPPIGSQLTLLPSPGYHLQASVPGLGVAVGEGLSWRISSPIQALEAVNKRLRELYPESEDLFDIVLVTNNHAQVGVRLINSINHYGEQEEFDHDPAGHTGMGPHLCRVHVYPRNLKPSVVLVNWPFQRC